jgi:hypothetical protein
MNTIANNEVDYDKLIKAASKEKLIEVLDNNCNYSSQLLQLDDGEFVFFDYSYGPWTNFLGIDEDRNPETDAPFEPGAKVFYEKRRGDYYPLGMVVDYGKMSREELIEVVSSSEDLDLSILEDEEAISHPTNS